MFKFLVFSLVTFPIVPAHALGKKCKIVVFMAYLIL